MFALNSRSTCSHVLTQILHCISGFLHYHWGEWWCKQPSNLSCLDSTAGLTVKNNTFCSNDIFYEKLRNWCTEAKPWDVIKRFRSGRDPYSGAAHTMHKRYRSNYLWLASSYFTWHFLIPFIFFTREDWPRAKSKLRKKVPVNSRQQKSYKSPKANLVCQRLDAPLLNKYRL